MSDTYPFTANTPEDLLARLVEMQGQLDFLRDQLTESQRLATIGTIAAVIAHEFNNLLTPIVSYSQYALTSANSPTPDMDLVRKALSKSFQSSSKAGKICSSMLGLARGESQVGKVNVREMVDEAISVLARDPQRDGIALRIQVQPDLELSGDRVQLEQVLLNLLINARQAMLGRGGSITIRGVRVDDEELKLQVSDTGPGIPQKLLPKSSNPSSPPRARPAKAKPRGPAWVWQSARRSWSITRAESTWNRSRGRERLSVSFSPPSAHWRRDRRGMFASKCQDASIRANQPIISQGRHSRIQDGRSWCPRARRFLLSRGAARPG